MHRSKLKSPILLLFIPLLVLIGGCGEGERKEGTTREKSPSPQEEKPRVPVPSFSPDSAYRFIEEQVAFGPRVPGTEAHKECGDYLNAKLDSFGWEVHEQRGKVKRYDGARLRIRNIYGRLAPKKPERIMLFAHWDTRMMADRDDERKDEPIPGANDGGSGVGVLLELARIMAETPPSVGVDIFFFDAEDQGQPEDKQRSSQKPDTWCLGTQYWAEHMPIPDYAPKYGILLDMVGDSNAVFPQEGLSREYAGWLVDQLWKKAARLGYGDRFVRTPVGPITDDHLYVNRQARIPSVNIVHIDPETGGFGPFHHTHDDDMDRISKAPLKAVGETLLEVIYRE